MLRVLAAAHYPQGNVPAAAEPLVPSVSLYLSQSRVMSCRRFFWNFFLIMENLRKA
jgi:hypothetical protein